MDVTIIIIAAVVVVLAVFILLRRPAVALISADELSFLKAENETLKISFAKAEEKAAGIFTEKENLTKHFKDEQSRLLDELLYERTQLAQANQALESSRSY